MFRIFDEDDIVKNQALNCPQMINRTCFKCRDTKPARIAFVAFLRWRWERRWTNVSKSKTLLVKFISSLPVILKIAEAYEHTKRRLCMLKIFFYILVFQKYSRFFDVFTFFMYPPLFRQYLHAEETIVLLDLQVDKHGYACHVCSTTCPESHEVKRQIFFLCLYVLYLFFSYFFLTFGHEVLNHKKMSSMQKNIANS